MKQERMKKSGIHPFVQLLSVDDLDDCDWLEHAAFDPIEAATREKVGHQSLQYLSYFVRQYPLPSILSTSSILLHHWISSAT